MYDKFAENIVQELMQNAHGDIQTRTDRFACVVIDLKFKNIKLFTYFPETVNYANCRKRDAQIALEKGSPDKCIFCFLKPFFNRFEYTKFYCSRYYTRRGVLRSFFTEITYLYFTTVTESIQVCPVFDANILVKL